MYTDAVDNPKLKLLAFEDRWHYVAFCCLKRTGLLDKPDNPNLERLIAVKLGVQLRELDEIKRRLMDVDLLADDFSPVNWEERQYVSDNSTERVRKHRANKAKRGTKREGNVSVTPPETDTESDTEEEKAPPASLNLAAWSDYVAHRRELKAKPLTKRGASMAMNKLARFSHDEQQAAVDQSIENGWTGLFPEKQREKTERGNSESFQSIHSRVRQRAGLDEGA